MVDCKLEEEEEEDIFGRYIEATSVELAYHKTYSICLIKL